MTWLKFKIDNVWTQPSSDYEQHDIGAWQVGFSNIEGITIVGIYDHIIESKGRFSNTSLINDRVLARCLCALALGYKYLWIESQSLEISEHSVMVDFCRWGSCPDDVAEWILFTNEQSVSDQWWKGLSPKLEDAPRNFMEISRLCGTNDVGLCWALDGHLYAAYRNLNEELIRQRLEPIAKSIGLRTAQSHVLKINTSVGRENAGY